LLWLEIVNSFMQWLISNLEPEVVNAPILTEELLQAGLMREILDHLPWYKKTRNMDVILAGYLIHIIRSGFERSFVLREMESLDIPHDVAERFLHVLETKGCCVFGEPRYFHAPVQFVSSFTKGTAVQNCYGRKVLISDTLAECLRLVRRTMPRKDYQEVLTKYLGKEEYAEQACQTLAHQGLLMSCDSTQTSVNDYGTQRWNLELTHHGKLLSDDEWEERLNFLEEIFQNSYFQSRSYFFCKPIRLCGDLDEVVRAGSAGYFWDLSFKLKRFAKEIPINLKAVHFTAYDRLQELRLQSPTLFDWGLTLDVRRSDELIQDLLVHLKKEQFSYVIEVRLLLGAEWPANLGLLNEHVRLKLSATGDLQIPSRKEMPATLRHVVEQYLTPHCQSQGCGPGLSLYIRGEGDIYSCSLEGGVPLGHISDGAETIEQRRRSLRRSRTGACRFGVNPDSDSNDIWQLPASNTRPPEFTCP
jgi:hypothetical protein